MKLKLMLIFCGLALIVGSDVNSGHQFPHAAIVV
jgi:hypothetical protein